MSTRVKVLWIIAASGCAMLAANPAQALTMQECSAKYKAAQTAGTLNGQKWNDFRKAECGTDAAATPAAAPAVPAAPKAAEARPAAAPAAPKAAEAKPKAAATAAVAPAAAGPAVFPTAVDSKYAKETAYKGRFKTCNDQYNANKAANANGGLKWVQKGGGYWSECNKKLKGSA
ncbi:MAG TPA: hypothetical protein VGO84_12765 [Burkholderiales bacterium]|nr:hypothetical protein [Burkholderiales bacterium]